MTNKLDQAALNALVNDCYPDGWPWRKWDIWRVPITEIGSDVVDHIKVAPDGTKTLCGKYWTTEIKGIVYPLAGTWIEGRLRELIGEAFRGLYLSSSGKRFVCDIESPLFVKNIYMTCAKKSFWQDTPIQALVAATRAVLKQKEVSSYDTTTTHQRT